MKTQIIKPLLISIITLVLSLASASAATLVAGTDDVLDHEHVKAFNAQTLAEQPSLGLSAGLL